MIGFMVWYPAFVQADEIDLTELPAQIAKVCGNPQSWVKVVDKVEVRFRPPPEAEHGKIACVLGELRKTSSANFGFIGNEADPDARLQEPERYIAIGDANQIASLAKAAKSDGWIIGKIAKADDGTTMVLFQTSEAETVGKADKLIQRIWAREFGDISIGVAPQAVSEAPDFAD